VKLLADMPRFMSVAQLDARVRSITYRPGWSLSVFVDPFEGPCLYVVVQVPDRTRPDQTIELRIRSNIPPIPTDWSADGADYFDWWLWYRLDLIERHECREFYQRGGRPVFDPHEPVEPGDGAASPAVATPLVERPLVVPRETGPPEDAVDLETAVSVESRWAIWWADRAEPDAVCPAHGEARCRWCAQSAGRGRRVFGRMCDDCGWFYATGMHWDTCQNRVSARPPGGWSPLPAWSAPGADERRSA
jgi:hypothetical protein